MENKNSEAVAPGGLGPVYFSRDGLPVFYYPGKRPMELPGGLLAGTLIEAEWPERERGIALFEVEEPPEGKTGVFIRALEAEETKAVIESGRNFLAYRVKIVEEAEKVKEDKKPV